MSSNNDEQHWTYRARPATNLHFPRGVVSADTLDVEIDLGFEIYHRVRVKLANVVTADEHGDSPGERAEAERQRDYVIAWIAEAGGRGPAWPLEIETDRDNYQDSQYLANVRRRSDGVDLETALCEEYRSVEEVAQ